ncbi:hypothetical protein BTO20_29295 [Mycobacterium dioxanotrophicus]|uniref:ESX-1 secretion-associated protein EspA/EspE-like domain-containing protein n=1 Tax=Mycobacterium dioxanotrophicus TaxID=482462 RepID=A0A1Y0CA34_9MYCO|nr:hypothetical protein [Mycobacterium dioxanotrophicus]ART72099.1 hypothetical protein BTO20_29295 [Mycobacterium dioxanotrophicus]
MSPAASPEPVLPSRSQIENWDTSHLEAAANRWRTSASESDTLFAQHRLNVATPAGGEWEGAAKDAALDRVTADAAVVRNHADVIVEAADIAENGMVDIHAAQQKVLEAIAEAEADGFKVNDDLSVRDTRRADLSNMAARHTASRVYAEDIRWNAERLVAADTFVSERLQAKAGELDDIKFDDEHHP